MNIQYTDGYGGIDVPHIQVFNPIKGTYIVRWDYIQLKQKGSVKFCEKLFYHKPSINEIKELITAYYNEQINIKILQGFTWNNIPVWLSTENQFNYKSAFDLAVQTKGANLPVTFKFGTDEEPVYYKFNSVDELKDFYTKAMRFIQETLAEGWKIKDSIDYKLYEI